MIRREDPGMRRAFGVAAAGAVLLLVGCEDQHGRDYGGYGAYPGGGYAGYPGDGYGGDAYDSYDDWRYRQGRDYGCDGGDCRYYYSDSRDACDWSECRDPDRRPVVIYDRSRRQYVHVFVPRNRDGGRAVGDEDRSGHRGGGWDRPDRNDRQRDVIEQRGRDERQGSEDEQLRRRQRDADERARQRARDRDKAAPEQRQGQDRGRGDWSGPQQRDQDRAGRGDRGGRNQDRGCGSGRDCSD
jgi:hypothetical protein